MERKEARQRQLREDLLQELTEARAQADRGEVYTQEEIEKMLGMR